MPAEPHRTDSPVERVARQIAEYESTGGQLPRHPSGSPLLLLTTRGRSTGRHRRTMLIFARSGKDLIVVASSGGRPTHPDWYLNLEVNPRVDVQVGAESSVRIARTVTGAEREPLWDLMTRALPAYQAMQASTAREFPVVALSLEG